MLSAPFVKGDTRVVGVCGWPVEHSLSPAMHNAAFAALQLPYIYVPFPVAPSQLEPALRGLHALGIVGVNLTIPHKESVLPFLNEITAEAREVGAVNTVHCIAGRLLGDNTDGRGFYAPLEELGVEMAGRPAVIFGAGGAARSVAFRLAHAGAALVLVNRTAERAERLAHDLSAALPEAPIPRVIALEDDRSLAEAMAQAELVVNTTRIGMFPNTSETIISSEMLHADLLVYDLVYNPINTLLLQQARQRGCRIITGVKMLVHQGAFAFERWTGVKPPLDIMEKAVLDLTPSF